MSGLAIMVDFLMLKKQTQSYEKFDYRVEQEYYRM